MNANKFVSKLRPAGLTLTAAVLVFTSGCSRELTAGAERVRPVKTMVVASGQETVTRSFSGRAEAAREVDLAFQVSGLLSQFTVREGAKVAKGQVIAALRQDEFQARLAALEGQRSQGEAVLRALRAGSRPEERLRLEAQARAAEARMLNAKTDFERHQELMQGNAVARSIYEMVETEYRVAQENYKAAVQTLEASAVARQEDIDAKQAEIAALDARITEVRIQRDDSSLRAPFDGVVAHRFVEPSQNISAGQPIVRFQDSGEIVIAMDVPESVMATEFRPSEIVGFMAEFGAAPGKRVPAEVREIAQVADPVTQTFKVRVVLKPPAEVQVLPGMTATVFLTRKQTAGQLGRISVPVTAVLKDSTGSQNVWVLGTDDTVRRHPVKVGAAAGSSLEILDGLKPGERIAVAGVSQLREGMKVRDLGDGLGGARP